MAKKQKSVFLTAKLVKDKIVLVDTKGKEFLIPMVNEVGSSIYERCLSVVKNPKKYCIKARINGNLSDGYVEFNRTSGDKFNGSEAVTNFKHPSGGLEIFEKNSIPKDLNYREKLFFSPESTKEYIFNNREDIHIKLIKLIKSSNLSYQKIQNGYYKKELVFFSKEVGVYSTKSDEENRSGYYSKFQIRSNAPYRNLSRVDSKTAQYKNSEWEFDIYILIRWNVKHIKTEKIAKKSFFRTTYENVERVTFENNDAKLRVLDLKDRELDLVSRIEKATDQKINLSEKEKTLYRNLEKVIADSINELIKSKALANQATLKKKQLLENKKDDIFKVLDKNGNGKLDDIEGKDNFMLLFKKHQKKIIELDKTYIQHFVKISNFLNTKKENIQKVFKSIKKVKSSDELQEQVGLVKNQIHFYNVILFHSLNMITSIVEDDLITFYEIYEAFDKLNIFNTNHQNEVSQKLDDINSNLNKVNLQLSKINKGIMGLMYSIQKMELSIVKEFEKLNYTTQESFKNLYQSVGHQLKSINSSIDTNNLLTGISTYQLYKINKQTKGLNS
jgi:hypothetical protein